MDKVKDYLPYYESGQLTKQLKYIADYYINYEYKHNYTYKFLTKNEVNEFIKTTVELIKEKI